MTLLDFCGDTSSAFGASKQSAECFRFGFHTLAPPSSLHDSLNFVEGRFGDERFVFPFGDFTGVTKMTVVERVGEKVGDGRSDQELSVGRRDSFACEKTANVVSRHRPSRVPLKCFFNDGSTVRINNNPFGANVVEVSEWGDSRIFSAPHLLSQPSFGVLGQSVDVVFALTKRHVEHELALGRVLKPKGWELERPNFSAIKSHHDSTAINAIAGEAIRMPRDDPRSFARL